MRGPVSVIVHPMKLQRFTGLMLLGALAACASSGKPQSVTKAETTSAAEAHLPEVRYYMIADT